MNTEQKKIAVGAVCGGLGMAVLVFVLYSVLPTVPHMDTIIDRVIFTLRLNVLAMLPLFIMLVVVGNNRFLSDAIDPLRHAENRAIEINGRVAGNTLEQNFLFLISTLVLSTYLSKDTITLIPALVIVFILARMLFWIGYRINSFYRAPGMAATAYMNVAIIFADLYLFFIS